MRGGLERSARPEWREVENPTDVFAYSVSASATVLRIRSRRQWLLTSTVSAAVSRDSGRTGRVRRGDHSGLWVDDPPGHARVASPERRRGLLWLSLWLPLQIWSCSGPWRRQC